MATASIGIGTNALASSIVLVCRPRAANAPTATRREFVAALKAELPAALAHLQRGNIAPVDLAQAAIGPGMAVYTRYAKVLDAEGKPLSVREALALINQTLDEALAEQEGDFDADSRWALAWFEQSGFAEGEYGVAETLSKAKNTSVSGMVEAGILASKGGKVRLLRPDELPADWDPETDPRLTAWETVHQLVRALEAGGESAAAELVAKLGSKAEIARELAYRLYTLCERKKRAQEALSYNGLVQSWPEITRLAREGGKAAADTDPTVRSGVTHGHHQSRTRRKGDGAPQAGAGPFVEREFTSSYKDQAACRGHRAILGEDRLLAKKAIAEWDAAGLLKLMWEAWNDVFRRTLGPAERSLVSELRDQRNKWAHQQTFSGDDAYRALDSAGRLLTAVSAPQADEIEKMKMELLRLRFDEQVRSEKRKSAGTAIESAAAANLKPWREVVTPHKDVASGRYQQAEFAADLWQVHLGEGTDEYRKPVEFFRRTYLTESLKQHAGRRGAAHLRPGRRPGGAAPDQLRRRQDALDAGALPPVLGHRPERTGRHRRRAAGSRTPRSCRPPSAWCWWATRSRPATPSTKPDGTVVRTLWGELAWQLGGKKAFERVRADDEKATSPGDVLRELFNEYGPCLILIDEWVAYARQLHDQSDLPAGGFETQFTFAQVLTESAKLAKNCLLVISLPASDTAGSPHTQADDVEVGGQRGREALDRLRNVVGRVESSWRPASAEEGFEIVRRRLFEPLADQAQFKDRDVVARAFADLYRTQHQEFPPECRDADYEKRIKAAYPIHPEIFDRLYTDWSTLVKFQRTRGVLRLMAAVIHSLWEKGDRNPLILPANIPIDDPRVQFELTRYLSDNWVPIIEKDVDGPSSLPLRLDGEVPNLGKFAACRRVARTIYLGSAPTRDGRQPRHRGPAREARLRDAGRVACGVWRRAATARSGRNLPLSGRAALLVFDAAHGHQTRRGPRRATEARPRQGGAGAGQAPASRPAQDGRLQPRSPDAGHQCRCAGRS